MRSGPGAPADAGGELFEQLSAKGYYRERDAAHIMRTVLQVCTGGQLRAVPTGQGSAEQTSCTLMQALPMPQGGHCASLIGHTRLVDGTAVVDTKASSIAAAYTGPDNIQHTRS
jgi:hypothetical protein